MDFFCKIMKVIHNKIQKINEICLKFMYKKYLFKKDKLHHISMLFKLFSGAALGSSNRQFPRATETLLALADSF